MLLLVKNPKLAALQRKFSTQESWLTPSFPLPVPDASSPSGLSDETAHREGAGMGINPLHQHWS